jgi:DNA primase
MFSDVIPFNISCAFPHPFLVCPDAEEDIGKLVIHEKEVALQKFTFDYYAQSLKNNDEAIEWLQHRKIYHPDSCEKFGIGFADNSIGNSLEYYKRPGGARDRGTLQRLGLFTPTGYQFLFRSIVFPYFGSDGKIVAAYGRRIAERTRNNLQPYLYWNPEEALFFNRQALDKCKTIILSKSPTEALTFECAGIKHAIATMGIYSFSDKHLAALEESGVQEVIIALDNTDAGNYVAGMIAQSLNAVGIACRRLALPRNLDVNAFAMSQDDHISALKDAVDAARPFRQTYSNLKARD